MTQSVLGISHLKSRKWDWDLGLTSKEDVMSVVELVQAAQSGFQAAVQEQVCCLDEAV